MYFEYINILLNDLDLVALICSQLVLVLQGCQAFLLDRADPREKR